MALASLQKILARLYTDQGIREQFYEDPAEVCELFNLTAEEREVICQLSSQKVEFFSESLRQKRFNEICKLLPLTHLALGDGFYQLFVQFEHIYRPHGVNKHHDDACKFATFIQSSVKTDRESLDIVKDLARFESAVLMSRKPGITLIVRLFRYPIDECIHELTDGGRATSPAVSHSVAIWLRLTRRSRLTYMCWRLPHPLHLQEARRARARAIRAKRAEQNLSGQ
jgi:hypothetical protein